MDSDVRKYFLDKRDGIGIEEIASKSAAIIEKLLSLDEFKKAGVVMAYVSKTREVCTHGLIKKGLGMGKVLVVPKIDKTMNEINEISNAKI